MLIRDSAGRHESRSLGRIHLDAIVIGFAKCATTTLCEVLAQHPEIFFPMRKDFRLFDQLNYEQRWRQFEERYEGLGTESVVCEASVWCTDAEVEQIVRDRLLTHFPEVRLLCIARDPVDRVESAFRQAHHAQSNYGLRCPTELDEALVAIPSLIDNSLFDARWLHYRRVVPQEQLKMVLLEDLVRDADAVVGECLGFLGVDPQLQPPGPLPHLNDAGNKLHDTKVWSEMQNDGRGVAWADSLPLATRNELLAELGFRKPFGRGSLSWSPEASRIFLSKVAADALTFLERLGKDVSVWPRLAQALETGRVQ